MSRFLALCGVMLVAAPAPAAAEWHLTPLVGLTFSGNTTLSDLDHGTDNVHGNYGASAALFGRGIFGFFSQRTGVRFDLRYHTSLHRQGQEVPAYGRPHVRYMTAAIGIVFRR